MRRTAVSESAGALVDGREEARRARGLPHLAGAFPPASVCFAAGRRFQMARRWTLVGVLAAGVLTVALLVPLGAAAQDGTPTCGGIAATIVGTPGNDTIQGTSGDDVIVGRGGNDTIFGLDGRDTICGDEDGIPVAGDDRIEGGGGGDSILLGDGANITTGGNDRVMGGAGNDEFAEGDGLNITTGGNDRVSGGDGKDTGLAGDGLDGGAKNDTLDGDTGVDKCVNGEVVVNCEV